jgi:Tol biopolymer transport system component
VSAFAAKLSVVKYPTTGVATFSLLDDSTGALTQVRSVSVNIDSLGFSSSVSAALSPDGTKIAWINPNDSTLHVMNADGTGDHVISRNVVVPTSSGNGAVLASTPVTASYGGGTVGSDNLAWAPDDHTIIFPGSATQLQPPANGGPVQVGVGSGIGLVRIEDDGTDALQLTSDQSLFAIHPSVTADGKYVVYQNYLSKYPLDHFSVMYASMDGSSNSLTTKPNGTEVPAPPGVVSIDTPSVAPNGRVYFNAEISTTSTTSGRADLMALRRFRSRTRTSAPKSSSGARR